VNVSFFPLYLSILLLKNYVSFFQLVLSFCPLQFISFKVGECFFFSFTSGCTRKKTFQWIRNIKSILTICNKYYKFNWTESESYKCINVFLWACRNKILFFMSFEISGFSFSLSLCRTLVRMSGSVRKKEKRKDEKWIISTIPSFLNKIF
jgi:hypothetical protein